MSETGQDEELNRLATVDDIKGLYEWLAIYIDERTLELYNAFTLALTTKLQTIPIDTLQTSISQAVSAGIPCPTPVTTIREIPDRDLEQLDRIEQLLSMLISDLPQIKGTMALLTQRKEVESQQLKHIIESVQNGVQYPLIRADVNEPEKPIKPVLIKQKLNTKIEQASSKVNQQIEQVKALLLKEPDLSVRQVAKVLKCSVGTAQTRLTEAKKRARV